MDNAKLTIDVMKVLAAHGIIREIEIRNFLIRKEYRKRVAVGQKTKNVREQLAKEFFLGTKAIESILYLQKNRKDIIIQIQDVVYAPDNESEVYYFNLK